MAIPMRSALLPAGSCASRKTYAKRSQRPAPWKAGGWNYSVGLDQINKANFARYGLTFETAFEPCANLRAMQAILGDCFGRASARAEPQVALRQAFSCYYSGNFQTGFQHGYVQKVVAAWNQGASRR